MSSAAVAGAKAIHVLVADSSRIHTQLLADALRRDPAFHVINWDADVRGLVAAVLEHGIDVLALSCNLDGCEARGLEIVRDLRGARPTAKAVVLLDSRKPEPVLEAFRAGARGVFSKDGSVEMFSKCIRTVHQGQIWADTQQVTLALEALASTPKVRAVDASGIDLLSKREMEVVRCLARGLSNREIAKQMGLSQHTIKNYLFRVFDKLGVSSRVELLFLTMSQDASAAANDAPSPGSANPPKPAHPQNDEASFALLQRAAEAGLPATQLALAQAYMARRNGPDDLVHACMWYLVSAQRALQIRRLITRLMTPEQITEAQHRAEVWLARLKNNPVDLPAAAQRFPPGRDDSPAKTDQVLRAAAGRRSPTK